MYQITRDEDGWHLFSHHFTFDSLMHSYTTRRQAITAIQMMREADDIRLAITLPCDGDEG